MGKLVVMNLVTEEFYISAGYGQSARVNTSQDYYEISNDTKIMVFNITEKMPVKI